MSTSMRRMPTPGLVLSLAAAALVAIAGCGGAPASAAPGTPVPSGVVTIDAKEYTFTPSAITVPAGSVNFSVRNAGNEAHQFDIYQGETRLDGIPSFPAGATRNVSVTLAAGDYAFLCKLNGHDQLGMKGTLTVTGG
jgi:plastocyanin